jgi:hypothetical protein
MPFPRSHPHSLAKTEGRGWRSGFGVYPRGGPELILSRPSFNPLALLIFEECHAEVAMLFLPALMLLDGHARTCLKQLASLGKIRTTCVCR